MSLILNIQVPLDKSLIEWSVELSKRKGCLTTTPWNKGPLRQRWKGSCFSTVMDLVEIAIPALTNPCIKWHDTHGRVTWGSVYNCLSLGKCILCVSAVFVSIDVLLVHHCLRNHKILNIPAFLWLAYSCLFRDGWEGSRARPRVDTDSQPASRHLKVCFLWWQVRVFFGVFFKQLSSR